MFFLEALVRVPAMTSPDSPLICSFCGEANAPERRSCWMCSEPLLPQQGSEVRPPPLSFRRLFGQPVTLLALGWLILFALLLNYTPGLAIVLLIVTTPPLIRMLMLARKRATLGRDTKLGQTLEASALSLGATLMIGSLGLISAVVTFFTVCLGMVVVGSSTGLDRSPAPLGFLPGWFLATLVVSTVASVLSIVAVVLVFRRRLRSRWNRDVEQE